MLKSSSKQRKGCKMADILMRYMTVSVDVQPEGMNLSCWMSTEEFWLSEVIQFSNKYTAMGNNCTWLIHANAELTMKMIAMVSEYADKICAEQKAINERRKLSNR